MADFDANIAASLADDEIFKGIIKQLHEAASGEVLIRDDTPCSKCSCKHIRMVKVPDYKLKLQIMEFLANRGVGRPVQAGGESEEKIHFERIVYMNDEVAEAS